MSIQEENEDKLTQFIGKLVKSMPTVNGKLVQMKKIEDTLYYKIKKCEEAKIKLRKEILKTFKGEIVFMVKIMIKLEILLTVTKLKSLRLFKGLVNKFEK